MALYAAFILFVGVPLMALTLDGGRVRGAEAKLTNATEAACTAYAGTLDANAWIMSGERRFSPDALVTAADIFYQSAPPSSTLKVLPVVQDGKPMLAECTGHTVVAPYIDLGLGDYSTTVTAEAKADWTACGFGLTSFFSNKNCSNAP